MQQNAFSLAGSPNFWPYATTHRLMAPSFLSDVERAFAFLQDEQGHQLLETDIADAFDNALVSFRSDRLRIRIIRERGQVFADFAPPDGPPEWCDAPALLKYLGSMERIAEFTRTDQRSVVALAGLIQPFYGAIAELYAAPRRDKTVLELRVLQEERARHRWA
jgi:hypothetical protein